MKLLKSKKLDSFQVLKKRKIRKKKFPNNKDSLASTLKRLPKRTKVKTQNNHNLRQLKKKNLKAKA
jgi:hypothetical protein